MKLYDYLPSGNSYKVRLLMSYLERDYTHVPIDIHKDETHTADFLAKNPAGQIPLLELDDGRVIAESNAILLYLGEGSSFVPDDKFDRAKMYQWMFFEQYKHEPAIAVARFIRHYAMESRAEDLPNLVTRGNAVLAIMDRHLNDREWFAGDAQSLADIALYAYTHVADEGGFELSAYPNIQKWLLRFVQHERHILITDQPSSG